MTDELRCTYTIFPDVMPVTKTEHKGEPWKQLTDYIHNAPTHIDKKHCPLISMAEYGGEFSKDKNGEDLCIRHAANVVAVWGGEIDYDDKIVTPDAAIALLRAANVLAILYTSPSHKAEAPKWRVLVPFSKAVEPAARAELVGRANRVLGGIASRESFTLSQSFYIGRVRGAEYRVLESAGRCIDTADDITTLYWAREPGAGETNFDTTTDEELRSSFSRGEDRYQAMLKLSSRWAVRGMMPDDIEAGLLGLLGTADTSNKEGIDLRSRAHGMALSAARKFKESRPAPLDEQSTIFEEILRAVRAGESNKEISAAFAGHVDALGQPDPGAFVDEQMKRARIKFKKEKQGLVDRFNDRYFVSQLGGNTVIAEEQADGTLELHSHGGLSLFYKNQPKVGKQHAFEMWLAHPARRTYDRIVFEPGKNIVEGQYNLWRGWKYKPAEGNCALFLEHMEKNVAQGNEEVYDYLLDWFAYLIQKPGTRPGVAIALRGESGVGKSKVGEILRELTSPHSGEIAHSRHLTGNFNRGLMNKVFVFCDEAFFAGDPREARILKTMVTSRVISIEPKGKDPFELPNHLHFMMASNDLWIINAARDERRYAVFDVGNGRKQQHVFFGNMDKEMRSGGYGALMKLLMERDLEGFNVAKFPQSSALNEQKLMSLSPLQKWWADRLEDGVQVIEEPEKGWQEWIRNSRIMDSYLMAMQKQSINRRAFEMEFARELQKMCPGAKKIRRTVTNEDRPYGHQFPSLLEARKQFNHWVGLQVGWPVETAADLARALEGAAVEEDDPM